MNYLAKLERKLGKYAVPHLIRYFIGAYAIGLVLSYVAPQILLFLTLEPYLIFQGQVWRLVSWIFIPENTGLLTLIMLLFYYQIGSELEYHWGSFRFNLYMFGGVIFTDIAAIVLYAVEYAKYQMPIPIGILFTFSTSYLNLSLFLAFAACFPEMQVRLYFLIPIKMKWLALVYVAITAYEVVTADWVVRAAIIASLLNFIIFYLSTRNLKRYNPNEIHRRNTYKRKVEKQVRSTKHKCAICGRTEEDDPSLQFRYCSKCDGNYEYCQDHLFTHQHVKRG